MVTVTAAGRGIDIDLTVNVLDDIKRIEFAEGQSKSYVLPTGGEIVLGAPVAYNKAEGGSVITGAEVMWVSSDTDVVSVDGNTITAESAGSAEITAQGGGVTSKDKIKVTVVDISGVITHMMANTRSTDASRTRAITEAVADDPDTPNDDETVAWALHPADAGAITITFRVFEVGHDGKTTDNDDTGLAPTIRSQNTDVIVTDHATDTVTVEIAGAVGYGNHSGCGRGDGRPWNGVSGRFLDWS